jgi:hypothetical protein
MFCFPFAAKMNFPSVVPIIGERPLCAEVAVVLATLKLCEERFIELAARGAPCSCFSEIP